MKIVISGSLDFTEEIKKTSNVLKELGHEVIIPKTSEDIINGSVSLEQIMKEKSDGSIVDRAMNLDIIRYYFNEIKNADAVLVLNIDKKNVKNYIGGATFMEMSFAHVLGKKLFLINDVPDMHYTDEIRIMHPAVLNGDLKKIE